MFVKTIPFLLLCAALCCLTASPSHAENDPTLWNIPKAIFPQNGAQNQTSIPDFEASPNANAPLLPAPGLTSKKPTLSLVTPTAVNPLPQGDAEPPPPPYDKELLRLASVMGTLSYLSALCPSSLAMPQKIDFYAEMEKLLTSEGATAARREHLIGAFNEGITAYQIMHHHCTPAAERVMTAYLKEGSSIAALINKRYGGS